MIMSRKQNIKDGQILLNDLNNYRPLDKPMADETAEKIKKLTKSMLTKAHNDEMTARWLSQTANPPRIPEFYTLTRIHKPTLVGRPIIPGCDGPTERISCFVDHLIQPIAQQESYLKDSKDFINFIENTKLPKNTILQWTLLAYAQTFLKKGSRLYAKHTKTSIKTVYQSLLSS